jgi:hypothetical protein
MRGRCRRILSGAARLMGGMIRRVRSSAIVVSFSNFSNLVYLQTFPQNILLSLYLYLGEGDTKPGGRSHNQWQISHVVNGELERTNGEKLRKENGLT